MYVPIYVCKYCIYSLIVGRVAEYIQEVSSKTGVFQRMAGWNSKSLVSQVIRMIL